MTEPTPSELEAIGRQMDADLSAGRRNLAINAGAAAKHPEVVGG